MMILTLVLTSTTASASTLKEKLEEHTDYVPAGNSVRDQLIEVAQHFHLPMAIEWLGEENEAPLPKLSTAKRTLPELLKAILVISPRHQMLIEDRIVSRPVTIERPWHFLLNVPDEDEKPGWSVSKCFDGLP